MRDITLRTDSLFTGCKVIYTVYSMLGSAVSYATITKDANDSWPVTIHLEGPSVTDAERKLLDWATKGLNLPELRERHAGQA